MLKNLKESWLQSPLEQFEILAVYCPWSGFLAQYLSFSNSNMNVLFIALFIVLMFFFLNYGNSVHATGLNTLLALVYVFIFTLASENIAKHYLKFFLYLLILFLFLIVANLFGMIPYVFTVTSHLVFTFFLAFASIIAINYMGIRVNGAVFFSLFLPNGSPIAIAPFLIIVETISYIARIFSLSIRLFANIMSGHTLLKILAGFSWTMLLMGGVWYINFLIPLVIVTAVTGLEICIAMLQAYVFTILLCIYINDALNLH